MVCEMQLIRMPTSGLFPGDESIALMWGGLVFKSPDSCELFR